MKTIRDLVKNGLDDVDQKELKKMIKQRTKKVKKLKKKEFFQVVDFYQNLKSIANDFYSDARDFNEDHEAIKQKYLSIILAEVFDYFHSKKLKQKSKELTPIIFPEVKKNQKPNVNVTTNALFDLITKMNNQKEAKIVEPIKGGPVRKDEQIDEERSVKDSSGNYLVKIFKAKQG